MKREFEYNRIKEHIADLLAELHHCYKELGAIEVEEESLTNHENFTYNKLMEIDMRNNQKVFNEDGTEIIFEKFIDTDGTEITLPIFIGYDSHNKPLYF